MRETESNYMEGKMPVKKKKNLTEAKKVLFNKKDMELLEKVAGEKRLSIASVIRMAVIEYLNKKGK